MSIHDDKIFFETTLKILPHPKVDDLIGLYMEIFKEWKKVWCTENKKERDRDVFAKQKGVWEKEKSTLGSYKVVFWDKI